MVLLGGVGWLGAWAATASPPLVTLCAGAALASCAAAVWRWRGRRAGITAVAASVVFASVATAAGVRAERVADNPLTRLAAERAEVTLDGKVAGDPLLLQGRFGDEALVRLDVTGVTARDERLRLRQPVVVFGATSWLSVPLGAAVRVVGHLSPSTRGDVAATLSTRGPPDVIAGPDPWWRVSAHVRAALRRSVSGLPPDRRALVPALVDGDDAGLDPSLQDDFRTTGLTHLLAVSGTNLTLVVGFALVVARWLRVRGRWLYVVGAAGIVGFVLVARAEPSVLRAAVMGTVALVGMGANGRDRGTRALGVATVMLLLFDPGLASAAGFALSVLATAGILLLAPGWRDALSRWLPRWLAEAVAVPAAAQLACTPIVAAISGQVSLVAVLANLLAAPAVGPATVLGLLGGLVTLVAPPIGRLVGTAAGWCVAWIVEVARHMASLPTPAVGWGSGPLAIAVLAAVSAAVAVYGPRLVRRSYHRAGLLWRPRGGRPGAGPHARVAARRVVDGGLRRRPGRRARPQHRAPHTAVVIDAGPDPGLMDACLSGLGVTRIPLVVLTHFHADHVDGLPGLLDGRTVDAVEVSRLRDPPAGVSLVRRAAEAVGRPRATRRTP